MIHACVRNHWGKRGCTTVSGLNYLEDQKRQCVLVCLFWGFLIACRVGNCVSVKVPEENGKTACVNVVTSQTRLMWIEAPKL